MYGREATAFEVLDRLRRDTIFYEGSGGGVTISGGEPLCQPGFLKCILELCREGNIHSCVETAGFCSDRLFENLVPLADTILFDLKVIDDTEHTKLTGQSNAQILANARLAASGPTPVLFRSPLIPGINDSLRGIEEMASFIRQIKAEQPSVELMPYHQLGLSKYEALGRYYPMNALAEVRPPDGEDIRRVQRLYEELGVSCAVSF
jgi:pyruvate formate lyase activating enzyme